MKPPNPKRNGGSISEAAACVKPKRPSSDELDESVKASGRNDLEAAQAGPRRMVGHGCHAEVLLRVANGDAG